MRVLQVIPELSAGGAERTVIDFVEVLTRAGHEAHVFTVGGRLGHEVTELGGHLHKGDAATKNPFKVLVSNVRKLRSLIERYDIDVIHAHSRAPAWSCHRAARAADIPFVTTYHGYYKAATGLKGRYNRIMARGDIVIANSKFTASLVRRQHLINPARLRIIPCGIDLRRFDPAHVNTDHQYAVAHRLGISEETQRPIIMLPGRLTSWKGQEVMIDALEIVAKRGHQFSAFLVGDSQGRRSYVQLLRSKITAAGLEDRIKMPGHCSDMPAALSLADIVACPSVQPETFGRAAAEALAMGKATVAANHGGAPEVIDAPDTGCLVKPGDANALADALIELLEAGPEGRAAIGAAGRQRIIDRFSPSGLESRILGVYQDALMQL